MMTRKIIALTIQTFVCKVMFLLFNMLSRFVIAFFPRSKHLLISWLQSPSTVIFDPKKIVCCCFHFFPHLFAMKGDNRDEMIGWHHRLDGHEFEQAPGVGDGQGSLACCGPWGSKKSDMTVSELN